MNILLIIRIVYNGYGFMPIVECDLQHPLLSLCMATVITFAIFVAVWYYVEKDY